MMKKNVLQRLKKTAATICALLLLISLFPVSTALSAEEIILKSDKLWVKVDPEFPRVIDWSTVGGVKLFDGNTVALTTMTIGTWIDQDDIRVEKAYTVTPNVTSVVNDTQDTITYTMVVSQSEGTTPVIDATITAVMTVYGNCLDFDITSVENRLDPMYYPVEKIDFPGNSLVSVNAGESGAGFAGAIESVNTTISGDTITTNLATLAEGTSGFNYAFVSNSKASAGMWSNAEGAPVRGGSRMARRLTREVSGSDESRVVGLRSSLFINQRLIRGQRGQVDEHARKQNDYQQWLVDPVDMPHCSVAIAIGDVNGDGVVNWQDGAIETRQILNTIMGSEIIPDAVGWRIAQNFSGQAGNPFLTTLDNCKRLYLQTDGLGQAVINKGFQNEGHDSAWPDFWDIGRRMGGAEEFIYLLDVCKEYGVHMGVHINTSDLYPESKAMSEDIVIRNSDGSLLFGWNWLDQALRTDGRYDHGSNNRYERFEKLKANLGEDPAGAWTGGYNNGIDLLSRLDFVYLDVFSNNYTGDEDTWDMRQISYMINRLGWPMAVEFGYTAEGYAILSHWASDMLYGSSTNKGFNSSIMRFLRNHEMDRWAAEHTQHGGMNVAPVLGGNNMKDFEGWQGRNAFDSYVETFFAYNVMTKFLQHYQVTNWEYGPEATSTYTPEKKVTLKNGAGDVVTAERKSGEYNPSTAAGNDFRYRTIQLNGVTICEGEQAIDSTSSSAGSAASHPTWRSERYLIPWYWDKDGNLLPEGEKKLYHFNQNSAPEDLTTTWTLPNGWETYTTLYMYELTDLGRTNEQEVTVVDGKVTITAESHTPYVLYPGKAGPLPEMKWGDGMHLSDPSFNSIALNAWDIETDPNDDTALAEVSYNYTLNPMMHMRGSVTASIPLTGMEAGVGYVAMVSVDNRSDGRAVYRVMDGDTEIDSAWTGTSIAPNYVRTDPHSSNSPTGSVSNTRSMFQRMYLFFTTPEDTSNLRLEVSHEKAAPIWTATFNDDVYWDDFRVTKSNAVQENANIKNSHTDLMGYKHVDALFQDFEEAPPGMYPFVMGSNWGVEDNRAHMSEKNAPYTQSGWYGKRVDDVLDGNWSLKINGTTSVSNGRTCYQTIPQLFRFNPGVEYEVSFDYQMGTTNRFALAVYDGNLYNPDATTGLMSSITTAVSASYRTPQIGDNTLSIDPAEPAESKHYSRLVTGAPSGQTWVGVVAYTGSNNQGTSGNNANWGGYGDLVIDNVSIRRTDFLYADTAPGVDAKAFNAAMAAAQDLINSTELADAFYAGVGDSFRSANLSELQAAVAAAKAFVSGDAEKDQTMVDSETAKLNSILSARDSAPIISGVTVTTPSIVETLAASLRINVAGKNLEGQTLTAYLSVDGELLYPTPITSGTALMRVAAAPAYGTDCKVVVKMDGSDAQGLFTMTLIAYNPETLWKPSLIVNEDGFITVRFSEDIAPANKGGWAVKVNGIACGFEQTGREIHTDVLAGDDLSGVTVVLSGVKYPLLFPSYSFIFTVTTP